MTAIQKRESKELVGAKRWAAYAAAGAASVVGAQAAEAAITHVVVNQSVTFADGTQAFALGASASLLVAAFDLTGGASSAGVALAAVNGGSLAGFAASGFPYASNLASGANVSTANFGIGSGTGTLAYAFGYGNDQFLDTGGFLGFRFDSDGGTAYGWARLELLSGSPLNEYILVDFAYGMKGEAIAVGQVPLPGSIWFLASGAAGLLAVRKRQQQAKKAA